MIVQHCFDLWSGTAEVATDEAAIETAVALTRETIEAVDRTCSTYRDDSDISRVNANAGSWVAVDPLFVEILEATMEMAAISGGALDPTVGSLSAGGVHLHRADWRRIQLRGTNVRIPGYQRLTLDSTAKAWCADTAAARAASATGTGVLVGLCGDVAVAGTAPEEGWPIICGDDHRSVDARAVAASVCIRQGAVATSSTTVRRGRDRSHIIDPTTMRAIAGLFRTISVAAASCLHANAAATAGLVLGSRAPRWLDSMRLPARLITHEGSVITTGGWPR